MRTGRQPQGRREGRQAPAERKRVSGGRADTGQGAPGPGLFAHADSHGMPAAGTRGRCKPLHRLPPAPLPREEGALAKGAFINHLPVFAFERKDNRAQPTVHHAVREDEQDRTPRGASAGTAGRAQIGYPRPDASEGAGVSPRGARPEAPVWRQRIAGSDRRNPVRCMDARIADPKPCRSGGGQRALARRVPRRLTRVSSTRLRRSAKRANWSPLSCAAGRFGMARGSTGLPSLETSKCRCDPVV